MDFNRDFSYGMTETTSGVISQSLEGGVPGKEIALKKA